MEISQSLFIMLLGAKMSNKKQNKDNEKPLKKKYVKPEIVSEDLVSFGAVCNGTTNGNRKASTGSPNFCNSRRLNS